MKGFENCLWVYLVEKVSTGRRFIACSREEIADAIDIPEHELFADRESELNIRTLSSGLEGKCCQACGWRICRVPRVFVGMVVCGDYGNCGNWGNAEYLCRDEQWNLYTLGGAPYPKEDVVQGSLIEITFEFYERELDKVLERAEELGL